VAGFFEDGRVDAAPRTGKMGGAAPRGAGRHLRPYLPLNHSGRQMTQVMAHEAGHGLHLARCLGPRARWWPASFALVDP
jgi:oligoendopeptidase F